MMKHKGLSEKAVNVIMWLYASFTLFVLGYLVYNSLRPKSEILGNTLGKPKEFTFENFTELFTDDNFGMFFLKQRDRSCVQSVFTHPFILHGGIRVGKVYIQI